MKYLDLGDWGDMKRLSSWREIESSTGSFFECDAIVYLTEFTAQYYEVEPGYYKCKFWVSLDDPREYYEEGKEIEKCLWESWGVEDLEIVYE